MMYITHIVSCFRQFPYGMASNISASSDHENVLIIDWLSNCKAGIIFVEEHRYFSVWSVNIVAIREWGLLIWAGDLRT